MSLTLFLLWIAATAIASPAPAANPVPQVTSQTGFTEYISCSDDQIGILKKSAKDAVTLALAGLDYINDELINGDYPQFAHSQVDFSKQAAIDFFGPEAQNYPHQQRIFDSMYKAGDAYPGWGFSDWWHNRYVALSCLDPKGICKSGKYGAYFDTANRDYGYPLVEFCPEFFTVLVSHDEAVKKIDEDQNLQQNVANLRSQASTFMHELLHINWGTAQECPGKKACRDNWQIIGDKPIKTYKSGRAKLLAQRDVLLAAQNNDNLVYYAMTKFMEKRYNQYPKYPSAWDPEKSREENENREKEEPGASAASVSDLEGDDVYNEAEHGSVVESPKYPSSNYPNWYKPLVERSFEDETPTVDQPLGNTLSYDGPNINDVICETTDGSPEIDDCINAFGTLKMNPQGGTIQGKKDTGWWAGYIHSCALSISYKEDWTEDCKATSNDVDDHASAIFEACQNPGNNKVGGRVRFIKDNCPAEIQIIKTDGSPPMGGN
ncbi:MAG: hypothetical protein M1837_002206 [Sclerophora amabilis]|nr:MAG: hypothetical protein M1837_002206 [Sclerophora amabilis]